MSGNHAGTPARDEQAPEFDEMAFIRTAERKSVRRTVRIASGIVLAAVAVLLVAWMGWRGAINYQAQRIRDHYVPLARMTMPNNQLESGRVQYEFPAASMTLRAYRRVGGTVLPAGEVVAHFYPWGGASFAPPEHLSAMSDGRLMLVPGEIADLLFLEPPLGGGDAAEVWNGAEVHDPFLTVFAESRATAIDKLKSAPDSATVEVAVSFSQDMTLEQLQERLGTDVQLVWGAVRVSDGGEVVDGDTDTTREAGTTWYPRYPADPAILGVAFDAGDGPGQTLAAQEASQLDELKGLARIAGRRGLTDYVEYLEANGAHYYGAVVTGSPEAVLQLAESADVSTVSLGGIAMSWQ